MKDILIMGANGTIGRQVTKRLLAETDSKLTLFLRNSQRLQITDAERETLADGDATDLQAVQQAMHGQDVVFATLGGDSERVQQARVIIQAMKSQQVNRLIWITGVGIDDELAPAFQKWTDENVAISDGMQQSKESARMIEQSGLNYTLLRCAWMTNDSLVNYETSPKGTMVANTMVSRSSITDYVVKLISHPEQDNYASMAVFQPGTVADKPVGYY